MTEYFLEKDNLGFRKTIFADCEKFARWEKQEFIMKSFSISSNHCYEDVLRDFFARETDPTTLQLTMIDKETDTVFGRIIVSAMNSRLRTADIWRIYIGDPAYLRKGLGEKAMLLLLEYLFQHLHMERVTLDHYLDNERAAALYQKLGFQSEGIQRHVTIRDGKYFDLHLMSMLREEYEKLYLG